MRSQLGQLEKRCRYLRCLSDRLRFSKAKVGGKESCLAVDRMYRKSSAKLQGMSSYQDDDHYYVPGLKEVVSSICGRNQE